MVFTYDALPSFKQISPCEGAACLLNQPSNAEVSKVND